MSRYYAKCRDFCEGPGSYIFSKGSIEVMSIVKTSLLESGHGTTYRHDSTTTGLVLQIMAMESGCTIRQRSIVRLGGRAENPLAHFWTPGHTVSCTLIGLAVSWGNNDCPIM